MEPKYTPLQIFFAALGLSSFGGLAALLHSGRSLTVRALLNAIVYSGAMGLGIALLWYNYFDGQKNVHFLLGVSLFAGIGGVTLLDFIIQVFKNGGINITISPNDGEPPVPPATGGTP